MISPWPSRKLISQTKRIGRVDGKPRKGVTSSAMAKNETAGAGENPSGGWNALAMIDCSPRPLLPPSPFYRPVVMHGNCINRVGNGWAIGPEPLVAYLVG